MSTLIQRYLALSLPAILACCGGGGSGSTVRDNGHGTVLPPTPSGAGSAGRMDGRYVVTAIEVVPDVNNSNPNPGGATLSVGATFDIRDGVVVTINGDEANEVGGGFGGGYPANEFYSNGPTNGDVTTFCAGATFPGNFLGGGFLRFGIVLGSTSFTTAVAESIEWYQFANPAVASWGHYRAVLVKQ